MSVLDVMSRVRSTEKEADRLLEEARLGEKEAVAAALEERETILQEAQREAARSNASRGRRAEEVNGRLLEELTARAGREQEKIRALAAKNGEKALAVAVEIFHDLYLQG